MTNYELFFAEQNRREKELADAWAKAEDKLAAMTAERDEQLQNNVNLCIQINSQQARIVELRESLRHYACIAGDDTFNNYLAVQALATPDDLSALRDHDNALIEKCECVATHFGQIRGLQSVCNEIANGIRSLKT